MVVSRDLINLVRYEVIQRREEGYDVEVIEEHVEHILRKSDELQEAELVALLHDLESLQPAV